MANYHFEVSTISRGKGRSLAKSVNLFLVKNYAMDILIRLTSISVKTFSNARFFCQTKHHLSSITFKISAGRLIGLNTDMMHVLPVSSRALCLTSCLSLNNHGLSANISQRILLPMDCVQSPQSMKVRMKLIRNGIILTFTSLCLPVLSNRMGSAKRKTVTGIRRSISISGVQNGRTCKTGLMKEMGWTYESAMRALKFRE